MLKGFFLGFFLLVLLMIPTPTHAVIGIEDIQPPNRIQSESNQAELIVSYEQGYSPDELEQRLQEEKAQASTIFGVIYSQILHIIGQKTEVQKTEAQIANIQKLYDQAGVIDINKIDTISKISPNTYILFVENGNISEVVKKIKQIPGVKSAFPNIRMQAFPTGSSIQEVQTPMDVQVIVKYKKGEAPQELEAQTQAKNTSLIGFASRIAEDIFSSNSSSTAEKKLERIRSFWSNHNYRYSTYAYEKSKESKEFSNTQVVTFQNSDLDRLIAEYKKLPEVEAVMPNYTMYAQVTPNDPDYPQLWAMPKISAPTAWDRQTGSSNVIVAVVDSGVDYNHPDLKGHVTNGYDFSTCDDTPQEAAVLPEGACNNPKQRDSDAMDVLGHGTHVAGTIGAIGNNDVGVTGINWNVTILAVKALGAGGTSDFSDVLDGIQYAADNGAKVINLSLGGSATQPCTAPDLAPVRDIINYARGKGAVIVAAAGNDGHNVTNDLLGSCPGVIVVGASTKSDSAASFSNYGATVDIAAPGVSILSTVPPSFNISSYQKNGEYASCDGTSMATPHVAGAAGLLLSINPNLTPDQIEEYLVGSADPISTSRPIGPRLNLAKAVDLVSGPGGTSPSASPNPTGASPSVGPTEPPITSGASPTTKPTGTNASPTTAPTQTQEKGNITISAKLPAIGPDGSDNDNPTEPTRKIEAVLTNNTNSQTVSGEVTYENGIYSGTISVPAGSYQVKIKLDNTLYKRIPGIYTVSAGQNKSTQTVTLVPGDINSDGILDIFDYNIMIECVTVGCGNFSKLADLNDDGVTNPADLNILLRQFATRQSD